MKNFNYNKLTFLLSIFGFIGSLIFYYSVLSEINPHSDPVIEVSPINDSLQVIDSTYHIQQAFYDQVLDSLQLELMIKQSELTEAQQDNSLLRQDILLEADKDWQHLEPEEQSNYVEQIIQQIQ